MSYAAQTVVDREDEMNATKAIKVFFEKEPHGRKIDARELIAFKNGSTPEEYQEVGRLACEALGETYEAPGA